MNGTLRWLALLAAACGDGEAGNRPDGGATPDGAPGAGITGTYTRHYVTDQGEQVELVDLSQVTITATVHGEGGTPTTYPGSGAADGTFSVPGVPDGEYYLQITVPGRSAFYDVRSDRHVVYDIWNLGRRDVAYPTRTTNFVLNSTGLAPYSTLDSFEIYSSNAGAIAYLYTPDTNAPDDGDTAFAGTTWDWQNVFGEPPLLDGAKGDDAFLTQLHDDGTGQVQALDNAVTLDPFTMVDGQTTTITTALAPIAQDQQFNVNLAGSQFTALAADVNPLAFAAGTNVYLVAMPGYAAHGASGASADLVIANSMDDLDTTVAYGNPFPASWDLVVFTDAAYDLSVAGHHLYLYLGFDAPYEPLLIEKPVLTPPTLLSINDIGSAYPDATGVTTTPRLSWSAPETGLADHYSLSVFRIESDGLHTAGRLTTTCTEVTIPDGIMQTGAQYVIRVTAAGKVGGVGAYAETATGVLTP